MSREVKKLLRWVQNNNKAQLAYLLGYENTNVIDGWIRRESIPSYQIERVLKIIEKDPKDEQQLSSAR